MPQENGQVNEKGVDENHLLDLYCIMQMITQARKRFCERGTCMKVTISDVAKLAGVSTASRRPSPHTINSTRYVSGETRDKVYRAIAELGYTPDASARSFRTGKKKTIGFIVPDISNKFFATMIEAVENCLSAHGYHLIIANTKENAERENEHPPAVRRIGGRTAHCQHH